MPPAESLTQADNNAVTSKIANDEIGHPKIRYRYEYRNRRTNQIIRQVDAQDFDRAGELADNSKQPVFDVIATYKVDGSPNDLTDSGGASDSKGHSVLPYSTPEFHIDIHSPAIINALQSVVEYYPGQDLTGDSVEVKWPYPILVHHYDELSKFREDCAKKEPSEMCVREKDAYDHLGYLLGFLDKEVMKEVNAENERIKKGFVTFEWLWVALKPGQIIMEGMREKRDLIPKIVQSVSGGAWDNPPTTWTLNTWSLAYDGTFLGRMNEARLFHKFDGENSQSFRIIDFDKDKDDEEVARYIEYGEKYWSLLKNQCKYHRKGPSMSFPYNEIDGLVMTDISTYYEDHPAKRPQLMGTSDIRSWSSDCNCPVCKEWKNNTTRRVAFRFADWDHFTLEAHDNLSPMQYFLCPFEMPAFIFRTRSWEILHLQYISEPKFDGTMINDLVMDDRRLKTLKAFTKSFSRINHTGEKLEKESWTADFVKGKGSGLTFLLHGSPGIECIAEYIGRPLMTLTCSDIGTDPTTVENNLTKFFKLATSWRAVLLIDEADVYMERRSTADLVRNSLVAGFLRALEFYDGILFLTTNRVGSFDDAFISRVHVQLYYPEFTDSQRIQVWETFTKKLQSDRGSYMRLNIDAKEYIRGAEMRALKWNGREIRNAFQTAVGLAEFDSEKDEEGRILLTDQHLRAVVELSRDFKDYLNELHKGDEGKRAERKRDRLDTYNKDEAKN